MLSGDMNTVTTCPQPRLRFLPSTDHCPRVGFDSLLSTLGVPASEPIATPLFADDRHGPTYFVSFFSTPEYLGFIELFAFPYVSPLRSPGISSGFPRLIDFFHPVRRPAYVCATRSHIPHVHTIISPAILSFSRSVHLFLILAGLLRHSVHIQKTPRVSFPHAQVIRYLSFPLRPDHIYPLRS